MSIGKSGRVGIRGVGHDYLERQALHDLVSDGVLLSGRTKFMNYFNLFRVNSQFLRFMDGFVLSLEFGVTLLRWTFETAVVLSSCHSRTSFISVWHGSSKKCGTGLIYHELGGLEVYSFNYSFVVLSGCNSS